MLPSAVCNTGHTDDVIMAHHGEMLGWASSVLPSFCYLTITINKACSSSDWGRCVRDAQFSFISHVQRDRSSLLAGRVVHGLYSVTSCCPQGCVLSVSSLPKHCMLSMHSFQLHVLPLACSGG